MTQRGRLGRQHLFCLVDLGVAQSFERCDFGERQFGKEAHKAADIGVLGVAPELPVLVGRQPLGIEPDGALRGFAHLLARRGRHERRRQSKQCPPVAAPRQFDAAHDVAPLVGAAHLQLAFLAPAQLEEIVGLQDRVVEFEKAERLVAFEPQPDAVLRQHAVDREMPADIAQERDVEQSIEPIGVVDHDRVARAVAELQEFGEDLADPGHVAGDLLVGQKLAGFVLPGGVADLRRAAAHQYDRLVAGLLEPAQQHDRHQVADMQAVGGAVVADIGRHRTLREPRIERREIGALMNKAAFGRDRQEGRASSRGVWRHGAVI